MNPKPCAIVNSIMSRFACFALTVFISLATCNITADTATTSSKTRPDAAMLFNGDRAFQDLVRQVEGGPRIPGSPGLDSTRNLIRSTLEENGWSVYTQDFQATSPLLGYQVEGKNIFGVYPKDKPVKYIISAHYDTRPHADQDPDPAKRMLPVPGANDGASGVAALLELARVLPQTDADAGVALVFFDLEDHGTAGSELGFCLGSRYFAQNLPTQVQGFQYGINLDMIADTNLYLPMEGYSLNRAPKLTFDLWRVGTSMFPTVWTQERGPSIYDDHMPFLALGMQYIDVIDIDYAPWHTTHDTIDKCSPQSLDIVGDVVLQFILNNK